MMQAWPPDPSGAGPAARSPTDAAAAIERRLRAALRASATGAPLAPLRALRVARLYRDRVRGAHLHNLLCGLSWLHQALLQGGLSAALRSRLSVEAAHLWLDVAQGECLWVEPMPQAQPLSGPLTRAARLLDQANEYDDPADLTAARERLHLLRAAPDPADEAAVQAVVGPALDALGQRLSGLSPTYEARRLLVLCCELLLYAPGAYPQAARRVLERAEALSRPGAALAEAPSVARLWAAALNLSRALQPRLALLDAVPPLLGPRERAQVAYLQLRAVQRAGHGDLGPGPWLGLWHDGEPGLREAELWDEAFADLQRGLYGAGPARPELWRHAGAHGAALRALLGLYLGGAARAARARGAAESPAQLLGWLHLAADVRLLLRHALARLSPGPSSGARLWQVSRDQDQWASALRAAALGPAPGLAADPFHGGGAGSACLAHQWATGAERAGVEAAALWRGLLRSGRERGRGQPPGGAELVALLLPGSGAATHDGLLVGHGRVGLCASPQGELTGVVVWRTRGGVEQRALCTRSRLGDEVRHLLAGLLGADHAAPPGARGRLAAELLPALRGFLAELLPTSPPPGLHLQVLAPGALRALPLLGLVLQAGLSARCQSLVHMPTWPVAGALELVPAPGPPRWACALQPPGGFGAAAIGTLRRAAPPHEVDGEVLKRPPFGRGAGGPTFLRLYGDALPFTAADVSAPCAGLTEVELWGWARDQGGGEVRQVQRDDDDRLPGLVRALLLAGVRGVLDLAWPVPDLVRALVCERHGLLRAMGHGGPVALRRAVLEWQGGLWALRRTGLRGAAALGWLDLRRRQAAAELGLDPGWVAPLQGAAPAPDLDEVTRPSHLLAFRYFLIG